MLITTSDVEAIKMRGEEEMIEPLLGDAGTATGDGEREECLNSCLLCSSPHRGTMFRWIYAEQVRKGAPKRREGDGIPGYHKWNGEGFRVNSGQKLVKFSWTSVVHGNCLPQFLCWRH